MQRFNIGFATLLSFCTLFCSSAYASISGTIVNDQSQPIAGCIIALDGSETTATTSAAGQFSLDAGTAAKPNHFLKESRLDIAIAGEMLKIHCGKSAPVSVELIALSGKRIGRTTPQPQASGRYTINLSRLFGDAANGIYLLRIGTGEVTSLSRIHRCDGTWRARTAALSTRTSAKPMSKSVAALRLLVNCNGYNQRILYPTTTAEDVGTVKVYDTRPNILFIMSDDHAQEAISSYGSILKDFAKTPNIDRLAREGILFRHCLVNNSICSPSRASILTGQYGHNNGVTALRGTIKATSPWVSSLLQESGYETALYGKWHLSNTPKGFSDYWIVSGQGTYNNPNFYGTRGKKTLPGYSTDVYTDVALEWLSTKRDTLKPFCLMLQFKAPHYPYDYPDRHKELLAGVTFPEPPNLYEDLDNAGSALKKDWNLAHLAKGSDAYYSRRGKDKDFIPATDPSDLTSRWSAAYQSLVRRYIRCITAVDDNVGRVLDYLDSAGLADNTILIYTADQGYYLGQHGLYDKRLIFEESLHMPFLVRFPPEIKPGSENDDLAMNIDFAETMLDYASVDIPAEMDGKSLRPLFKGKTPADWRETAFYAYWSLGPDHYGIRTADGYTFVAYKDGRELYDLNTDPWQVTNQVANPAYAATVTELEAKLSQTIAEVGIAAKDLP